MSEKGNRRVSRHIVLWFIVIAVLSFLAVGIGYMWPNADAQESIAPLNQAGEEQTLLTKQNATPDASSVVHDVKATATAPLAPTAIATSASRETALALPSFENPLDDDLAAQAVNSSASFFVVNEGNTGIRQYAANNFVRPIALEVSGNRAFILDSGRVLGLSLAGSEPPSLLLAPGDDVEGVRVLEPLDLALTQDDLLVLDRAGDVYRYGLDADSWELDRYDRPVEASSGHYFVAVAGPSDSQAEGMGSKLRTLLETNYKFVMQYDVENESIWNLAEGRSVDVSVLDLAVFVLQRDMFDSRGSVSKYQDTRLIDEFSPTVPIDTPRQIVASDTAVYVLDRDGRRLLGLDPENGTLLQLWQLPQEDLVSVFAVDQEGRIILAGRDRLYLVNEPDLRVAIPGGPTLEGVQPHDPLFLGKLNDFTVPIGGSNITFRDFQMPGAPRHYRLGVHEGFDLYWQPGTKVLAAADGTVVRADLEYVGPTAWQLAAWWNETQENGYTSQERLNDYLGRQIWIEHEGGLITRYAHLRSIEPGIATGVAVSRGEPIGEVGNSGSPASLESEQSDAHLHFELWLTDRYLGQFMRPIETRKWIESIFPNRR